MFWIRSHEDPRSQWSPCTPPLQFQLGLSAVRREGGSLHLTLLFSSPSLCSLERTWSLLPELPYGPLYGPYLTVHKPDSPPHIPASVSLCMMAAYSCQWQPLKRTAQWHGGYVHTSYTWMAAATGVVFSPKVEARTGLPVTIWASLGNWE